MHTREFRLGQAIFAAELLVARARTRPEACWVRCEDLDTSWRNSVTKKTKPKEQLEFPDETTVDADFTKCRVFAVHKPLTGGKGYVVTHVKSHACVLRAEKKNDATAAAKALAFLFDRIDHGELRWLIEKLRFSVDESTDS